MIDAYDVIEAQRSPNAAQPPAVAACLHAIPAVEGIAPELTGGAKIVGWHPSDNGRLELLIQEKFAWIGPGVRAVHRHKNRNVTNDLNAPLIGIGFELLPLAVEKPLVKFMAMYRGGMGGRGRLQGRRLTAAQPHFPLIPRLPAVGIFERHKKGKVVEPIGFGGAKLGKVSLLCRASTLGKITGGAAQQG